MYENFGAIVDQESKAVTFNLFMPSQCGTEEDPQKPNEHRITKVSVVGDFQASKEDQWNTEKAIPLEKSTYTDPESGEAVGTLYSVTVEELEDGYYEYKYRVEFEKAPPRLLTDPCARYGGTKNQNSGFVVGEELEEVRPIKERLPLQDLVIYELMVDDFTAEIRESNEAPFQAVTRKLDELHELGINAIEFMPWTAWGNKTQPGESDKNDFSWGYDPVQYFAVAHKYVNGGKSYEKLVHLKRLINACHERGIHVIMDAVFNHADGHGPDKGFPYYWLYQNPEDSPFVGEFEAHDYFEDLDYSNQCTLEYIRDSCLYWIDNFHIDGIRFDNTQGYFKSGDRSVGLNKLLDDLHAHLEKHKQENFSLTLEHTWDYEAIQAANESGASSCWLDPYRSRMMSFLSERPEGVPQIEPDIMRILDAGWHYAEGLVPTVYIENHDHRRIARVAGGHDCWHLTQPYMIALFTSPGAVLIYNGQEWGMDNDMPEDGEGRVKPRPLDWDLLKKSSGVELRGLYQRLIKLRHQHPALRTSNFFPSEWDEGHTEFNEEGFGLDCERNLVVFHRWGSGSRGKTERFYVVLNFSPDTQSHSFEVPHDGPWAELLSGTPVIAKDGRLDVEVGSNWGAIYYRAD